MNTSLSATPVYELEGVEQHYGDRVAMRCDHLRVEPGRIVGITGPNGAGKSTLLSILAFLTPPWRGVVRFQGEPVRQAGDVALRRQAVLLPQDPALLGRRVEANVLHGLRLRGVKADTSAAADALELVGLDPARYLRRWWWELSGGETRRVALAARLAIRPLVLLLDEPTASLDPESADLVRAALLAARERRGLTVVAVSHDREWLDGVCDDMYRLGPRTGMTRISREGDKCER